MLRITQYQTLNRGDTSYVPIMCAIINPTLIMEAIQSTSDSKTFTASTTELALIPGDEWVRGRIGDNRWNTTIYFSFDSAGERQMRCRFNSVGEPEFTFETNPHGGTVLAGYLYMGRISTDDAKVYMISGYILDDVTGVKREYIGFIRNYDNADNWLGYFYYGMDFIEWFINDNGVPEESDPYARGGGASGSGGGGGSFTEQSDPIDFPPLPTLSAVDTGFVTVYNPTGSQMRALSSYMWSDDFFDNILKLWADPMQVILGLSIVPVDVPSGVTQEVKVGNVSTGINMTLARSQYVEVDCGTLNIAEFWGAYLDYTPYTKIAISLPYCGVYDLDVDEIMNKSVHVKYHIDILSGTCLAYVKCGNSVLYTFQGNVSVSVPVTGENWSNAINTAVQVASNLVPTSLTGVSGGGATDVLNAVTSSASASVNLKPSVEHAGSFSGSAGAMGVQYPYLIIHRPRQCVASKQNTMQGYPSHITSSLSDVTGYTIVESINLSGIKASDTELQEIEDLLKSGVLM